MRTKGNLVYDPISNLNANFINKNAGVVLNNINPKYLSSVGGFQNMIPLFYLLKFCKFKKYEGLLNELFKLLLILLKNKPDY